MKRIAVLGSGCWGTTLSLLLHRNGHDVTLWSWSPDEASRITRTRQNPYLPGFHIPNRIRITGSMDEALGGAEAVVFATISDSAAEVAGSMKNYLAPGIPVICATKGLSSKTRLTMTQTIGNAVGGRNPLVALSGPNLAIEIANGQPSASTAACTDETCARQAQELLMSNTLRIYTNTDVIGVELAGALKNVIAIGAGISDGLGFGDNTKAALLTRGLAEITRLGVKLGASQATFMGLSGIGDLMATCASPLSRNRRVGLALAAGKPLETILKDLGQVAEGVPTTAAARQLGIENGVLMPITEEVHSVLFSGKPAGEAVAALMTREPKDE